MLDCDWSSDVCSSDLSCHHVPEVYSGLAEREASDLLKGFFRERR
jgi:tRNA(Arg) A34 adenosine deaminase TadA